MNIRKQYKDLTLILCLFLVIIFSCGCLTDNEPAVSENVNTNNNSSGIVPEDFSFINESNEENVLDIDSTSYTAALKETAILELENGYSLKVLDVDKQKELILVSFRKDGNEYATRTMLTGHTYSVKDTKDQNVIYSIHVDEILDNSFVVELTYTIKPGILLETEVYEGKVREIEVRIMKTPFPEPTNGNMKILNSQWNMNTILKPMIHIHKEAVIGITHILSMTLMMTH